MRGSILSQPKNLVGCHLVTHPASMIQRQFWTISQLDKKSTAYVIPIVFMLKGDLHIPALEESINEIILRHEILRTNFINENGRVIQKLFPSRILHLAVTDISHIEEALRRKEMAALIERQILQPFDLEKDPLLKCFIIRLQEKKHVLCLVIQHIITDLRSVGLFASELSRLYNARLRGKVLDLGTPRQYAEYTSRQAQWLTTSAAEEMVAFWRKQLQGQGGVLNLPVDFNRPAGLTYKGDVLEFCIDGQKSKELRELCRQWTVDIYVVLLAAFLVLLRRYTNQPNIVVGVPFSNRRYAGDEDVMGCFVNTLPLAFDLEEISSFRQLVRSVRLSMLHAHRHQEMPFEAILNSVKPKRDPSYNPIFQVGFTAAPYTRLELDHLAAEPMEIHNKGAQLDLFLIIRRLDKEISGYFEFNADLFTAATIERMRDHYITLLTSVSKNPDLPVNLLPMLTAAENEQLLVKFNNTTFPVPKCTIHQLIEEKTAEVPEALAAVFEGNTLTYSELNARANQLARLLRDCGVGPDTLVGVFLERSLEMLIAVYAIIKAGGAYVPLDREFPQQRIRLMIEDAQPKVILTQEAIAGNLLSCDAELICLDRDFSRINAYPTENPPCISSPENLAYVLFTSGSTGRPKGVQVPHRAVVNFLLSMQKEPGISAGDILLAVTTLSFDISVLELFLPLTVGASIVIASTETARDGRALLALMQSCGATIMQATPTTFHLLLVAGWNFPLPVKVLCGGESFPQDLAQKLTGVAQSVWNMYGPTETTVWSTCYKITEGKPILIGRPIANTQVYIVNDQLQPTPIGVAGELFIGGLGVSRGYMHRPELNEKQFIRDIFNPDAKIPLYRTGDLACYLPDGNIKILGRIDHQIKIRGFRIELGEIETAITSHPAVRQAVVKPYEFASGDVRLCAYITVHEGRENIQLRPFLMDMLPEYMIPSMFTILEQMPLTPNNKIDRKSLPDPDRSRPEINREMILPQNEMEIYLARKWTEMLHIDQVGIDDSFFDDLGGYSLLSIQLIAQVEQEMKIKIPVVKFYQYPTVRLFAQYLLQQRENHGSTSSEFKDANMERARKQQQAIARIRKHVTGKL